MTLAQAVEIAEEFIADPVDEDDEMDKQVVECLRLLIGAANCVLAADPLDNDGG